MTNVLKSSKVPKIGSTSTKLEMSYPKSTMGEGKKGESHKVSMPISSKYFNFEVIPKRTYTI